MLFTYKEVNKIPIIIIDKYYSSKAEKKIIEELCFLNNDLRKSRKNTDDDNKKPRTKFDKQQKILKKNKTIELDYVYADRDVSNILTENRKLFSLDVTSRLCNINPMFKYMQLANSDETEMCYCESEGGIKNKINCSVITAISWFYLEPKSFVGGDLTIENTCKIECVSNRIVIFPSFARYSVENTKMTSQIIKENSGKFTVTQSVFINC